MVKAAHPGSLNALENVKLDAKELDLEHIPFDRYCIKQFFIHPVLNYVLTKKLISFFGRISKNPVILNLKDGPGSWKSMLAHYDARPANWIDYVVNQFISFSPALRNRHKLVIHVLARLMEAYGKEQTLKLVEVGCGSGNILLQVLGQVRSRINSLRAQLFDLDADALKMGQVKSRELGLDKEIAFIHAEANQIEMKIEAPPHIVKMIGLLEYLSDQEVVRLFESVRRFRNPQSSILISSIEEKHGIERFLKRTLNFRLNYRDPEKLTGLLSRFGYRRFHLFPEPTGLFTVIAGHT